MKRKVFLVAAGFLLILTFSGLGYSSERFFMEGAGTKGVKTLGEPSLRQAGITTITFEGVGNLNPVGTQSGVVFASAWVGAVDSDAGGTGNFANEPSPDTAPSWDGTPTQVQTRITLPNAVNQVSFYYCLNTNEASSVAVYYYDQSDTLLGTKSMDVCGADLCGNNCTGDPNGDFCSWTKLTANYTAIKYVEFQVAGVGSWGIDNFEFGTSASIPTLSEWGMIVLSILLLGSTLWVMRRKRAI